MRPHYRWRRERNCNPTFSRRISLNYANIRSRSDGPQLDHLFLVLWRPNISTANGSKSRRHGSDGGKRKRSARPNDARLRKSDASANAPPPSKRPKATLRRDARAWREAADIRACVEAVSKAANAPETTEAWARWALLEAERFDPIVSGRALQTITNGQADELYAQSTRPSLIGPRQARRRREDRGSGGTTIRLLTLGRVEVITAPSPQRVPSLTLDGA